ncbi:uncharacterized protein ATNIH1004_002709 [Aspergillus tanneri]|uniref:RRM domain-containing protein n=1 Tax=Aspergillus tanneri TaxID=1220188 RepID=A0A5M9MZD8_9EURO|nr:uncharacterized protein ATNIH1004_002709 [Aspergillus tanneri]KAA8650029.1 hypothetical protein ATNIH1004_002709 [Aspergillus tanneri]
MAAAQGVGPALYHERGRYPEVKVGVSVEAEVGIAILVLTDIRAMAELSALLVPQGVQRGTAYILYHDPADAEAAIAHMHEAQLDVLEAPAANRMAVVNLLTVALASLRTLADLHLRSEGMAVPGLWKSMISIVRGL